MIFDTHAHYDSGAFNADRFDILASMPEKNVGLIVDPGCDLESSRAAIALAEKYDFVYAAIGWHPEDMDKLTDEGFDEMIKLMHHPKCVAVGEIGLDYYWDAEHKDEQKALFIRQIELALELDKPVIVHDREAHGDSFDIVCRYPELRGVFHCYSGSAEMAAELLKRGWYLGFDGPITYKNARKALGAANVPTRAHGHRDGQSVSHAGSEPRQAQRFVEPEICYRQNCRGQECERFGDRACHV